MEKFWLTLNSTTRCFYGRKMLKFHNSDLWIAWLLFLCVDGRFSFILFETKWFAVKKSISKYAFCMEMKVLATLSARIRTIYYWFLSPKTDLSGFYWFTYKRNGLGCLDIFWHSCCVMCVWSEQHKAWCCEVVSVSRIGRRYTDVTDSTDLRAVIQPDYEEHSSTWLTHAHTLSLRILFGV